MLYRATLADIDLMAAIHATGFSARDAWSPDVFDLQLGLPGVFGMLHRSGGMILVRVAADEAEILTIVVTPAARRGGVAKALLSAATALAVTMGAGVIFLEVSVANISAFNLYTQAGFVEVGRRRRDYSDNSDALVLRLDPAALSLPPEPGQPIAICDRQC